MVKHSAEHHTTAVMVNYLSATKDKESSSIMPGSSLYYKDSPILSVKYHIKTP